MPKNAWICRGHTADTAHSFPTMKYETDEYNNFLCTTFLQLHILTIQPVHKHTHTHTIRNYIKQQFNLLKTTAHHDCSKLLANLYLNTTARSCHICYLLQCIQKVAVHLQKLLETMSTSVYTRLNLLNFIRKHFLQIWWWDFSYECSYCSF
jgi:hypothetical protein